MTKARVGTMLVCFRQRRPSGASDDTLPVLLVHGAASSAQAWYHQLRNLGRHRQVVAVDLPGHGCTKGWVGRDITVQHYAENAAEFMEAVGLERALVVGHSMGGAIALELALLAPEKVAGLVIGASGARLPVSSMLFDLLEHHFDQFGEFVARYAFGPNASPEELTTWTDLPPPATQSTILADFRACDAFDLRHRLSDIRKPALVLWGDQDKMVPRKLIEELAHSLPNATLHVLEGVGHMIFQEAPEETSGLIEEFCRKLDTETD